MQCAIVQCNLNLESIFNLNSICICNCQFVFTMSSARLLSRSKSLSPTTSMHGGESTTDEIEQLRRDDAHRGAGAGAVAGAGAAAVATPPASFELQARMRRAHLANTLCSGNGQLYVHTAAQVPTQYYVCAKALFEFSYSLRHIVVVDAAQARSMRLRLLLWAEREQRYVYVLAETSLPLRDTRAGSFSFYVPPVVVTASFFAFFFFLLFFFFFFFENYFELSHNVSLQESAQVSQRHALALAAVQVSALCHCRRVDRLHWRRVDRLAAQHARRLGCHRALDRVQEHWPGAARTRAAAVSHRQRRRVSQGGVWRLVHGAARARLGSASLLRHRRRRDREGRNGDRQGRQPIGIGADCRQQQRHHHHHHHHCCCCCCCRRHITSRDETQAWH
jgi:hypothetical protein